ncbi:hypothetical protein [Streptomyces sp. NPDC020681]|uniref:hypothetical protein n=1 Tax=Streptomyces sp. NPDC020681 TaxID=3365083 RepID=UPI0037B339E5
MHTRERLIQRDVTLRQLPYGARQTMVAVLNGLGQSHHFRQPQLRGFVERLVMDGGAQISGSHRAVLVYSQPQETKLPDIRENLAQVEPTSIDRHVRFLADSRIRDRLKHQLRQQAAL